MQEAKDHLLDYKDPPTCGVSHILRGGRAHCDHVYSMVFVARHDAWEEEPST